MMKKPATLPPKPRSLAQEQADFTSEGSPPPGKVSNADPQTPSEPPSATPDPPQKGGSAGRPLAPRSAA